MNEELYLDSEFLSQGLDNYDRKIDRCNMYCLYSGDNSVTSLRLDSSSIRKVYENDVMRIARCGGYMGIWQFHQAAQVIKIPIGSVYPDRTNPNVRKDLNRMIFPRNSAFHNLNPVYVMWSPLSIQSQAHDVKHFVVLLQKYW